MTGGLYRDDAFFAKRGLSRAHLNRRRKDLVGFIKDFFVLFSFRCEYQSSEFLGHPVELNYPFVLSFPQTKYIYFVY